MKDINYKIYIFSYFILKYIRTEYLYIMVELYRACKNNDINKVKKLLENNSKIQESRIDVNYMDPDDNIFTPLVAAYGNENLEMMKLLLKHGADPNIQIIGGNTLLIFATYFNSENIVLLLLENSHKYINIYIKNDINESAINCCYGNKYVRMANILISYSTYIRNHKNQTQFLLLIFLIHKNKFNLPNEILFIIKSYHTPNFKYINT